MKILAIIRFKEQRDLHAVIMDYEDCFIPREDSRSIEMMSAVNGNIIKAKWGNFVVESFVPYNPPEKGDRAYLSKMVEFFRVEVVKKFEQLKRCTEDRIASNRDFTDFHDFTKNVESSLHYINSIFNFQWEGKE